MDTAEKTREQAQLLKNRLLKNHKILRKWARKNFVAAYRLYDRDIPEIPLAIDLYEFLPEEVRSPEEAKAFMEEEARRESQNVPGAAKERLGRTRLKIFLYERPYKKPEAEELEWLEAMTEAAAQGLGIDKNKIAARTRLHDKGGLQYAKKESQGDKSDFCGRVFESGMIFFVDLKSYLDTGLFLDMRLARKMIMEQSEGKRVLNLFCYTSSFSVAAALGGAKSVQSVDLSNTYLDWSKKNFSLNGFDVDAFEWTKADAISFLKECPKKYDLIILDSPTFSNSKSAKNDLDIKRDWAALANDALRLLDKGGLLYFSTNARQFKFDSSLVHCDSVQEITEQSLDEDFKTKKSHKMWLLQK